MYTIRKGIKLPERKRTQVKAEGKTYNKKGVYDKIPLEKMKKGDNIILLSSENPKYVYNLQTTFTRGVLRSALRKSLKGDFRIACTTSRGKKQLRVFRIK